MTLLFTIFIINFSTAQGDLVQYSPFEKNNNNYLVINTNQNPEVVNYVLEIKKGVLSNDSSAYRFQVLWTGELDVEGSFIKIPESYLVQDTTQFAYFLKGYNRNGVEVLYQNILNDFAPIAEPEPYSYIDCFSNCNGPDYAYGMKRVVNDPIYSSVPSSYYISLSSPGTLVGNNFVLKKFYQYMDVNQFSAWEVANSPVNYYKVKTGLPSGDYYDSQNNLISGFVYGVEKDLGPWKRTPQNPSHISAPYLPQGDQSNWYSYTGSIACSSLFQQGKELINQNTINYYNAPKLVCKSVGQNGSFKNNSSPAMGETTEMESMIDCIWESAFDPDSLGIDVVTLIDNCMEKDDGFPNLSNEEVHSVSLQKVKNIPSIERETLFFDEFVNENNKFRGYKYSLEQGLYDITLIFKNKSIYRFLSSANSNLTFSKKQSDIFNVLISPSPIASDYNLILKCKYSTDNVNYKVFSPQQDLLFETEIEGFQDNEINRTVGIEIGKNVNNYAFLVHYFTFTDGSSLSYTTLTK